MRELDLDDGKTTDDKEIKASNRFDLDLDEGQETEKTIEASNRFDVFSGPSKGKGTRADLEGFDVLHHNGVLHVTQEGNTLEIVVITTGQERSVLLRNPSGELMCIGKVDDVGVKCDIPNIADILMHPHRFIREGFDIKIIKHLCKDTNRELKTEREILRGTTKVRL